MQRTNRDRWKLAAWRAALLVMLLGSAWWGRDLGWGVVWQAAPILANGLAVSCELAISSVALGMVGGILLAAARLYGFGGLRHAAVAYIEIVRAVPQVMVIFWVYFSVPLFTGMKLDAWPAGVLALSMIASAYLAEVMRAGLLSVPRIQRESAYATGVSGVAGFLHIILPQALRNMLPALIAHFIMMFKLTSVIYIIGLTDFFRAIVLVNNRDFAPYALYLTAGIVYFCCSYILGSIVRRFDPKYTLSA